MLQAIRAVYDWFAIEVIGRIKFDRIVFLFTGKYYRLTSSDRDQCKDLMETGHYIWLNRRSSHLTTYIIDLLDRFVTKTGGKNYTHAFFNISDDLLIEAIGKGVIHSYFDEVFDCDWICALKLRGLTDEEWVRLSEAMVKRSFYELNKKYDTTFNLKDESRLSCVELIMVMLRQSLSPDRYVDLLGPLLDMIKVNKNLTPQMIYDCGCFEIVLEIRR